MSLIIWGIELFMMWVIQVFLVQKLLVLVHYIAMVIG